jgi:hypothetical protein
MVYEYRQKLFYLFLLLSVFQNTILVEYLNYLGLSVSFLFSFLLILSSIFFKNGFHHAWDLEKYLFFAVAIVTLVGFAVYWNTYTYSEYGYSKGVKLLILNLLFWLPFYIRIKLSRRIVEFILVVMVIICFLGFMIGDVLGMTNPLMYLPSHDGRPRGFSVETSYYGATLACLALCILAIFRGVLKCVAIIPIGLMVLSTSKGALFFVLLSMLFSSLILYRINRIGYLILFLAISVLAMILYLVFEALLPAVYVEGGTTFSTRFVVWYLAIESLISNLFGVSYAGYLYEFQKNIADAINFVRDIPVLGEDTNLYEVVTYISTDLSSNIGTKSFLMDNVISYGVIAIALYVAVFFKMYNKLVGDSLLMKEKGISPYWAIALLIYIFFSLSTYVHGVGFYFYPAFFIILNNIDLFDKGGA